MSSCSEVDIKAYVLAELDPTARRKVEAHAAECEACREEISRVALTRDALGALRDEEIPRRIAFVSDKVFEPRWWQAFLKPGFAAAALVAAAILAHGMMQPGAPNAPAVDQAAIEARIAQEVNSRMDQAVTRAVTQAVADSESRQARKTTELISAAEQRFAFDRKADLIMYQANLEMLNKQFNRMYAATNRMEVGQ